MCRCDKKRHEDVSDLLESFPVFLSFSLEFFALVEMAKKKAANTRQNKRLGCAIKQNLKICISFRSVLEKFLFFSAGVNMEMRCKWNEEINCFCNWNVCYIENI